MAQEQQGTPALPRVVFVGLASCFGCQINITNAERYLLDVLGQIDLLYWQLTSAEPMPEAFDVAVIEGAVTTEEAAQTCLRVREQARVVITIGACAATAGIPGLAFEGFEERAGQVYGDEAPSACGTLRRPQPVKSLIKVDYEVACCPVDPNDFVDVLQRVLYGSNKMRLSSTLCGECKRNERGCFYGRNKLCLGLVTRSGCGARCPNLGRPCNGCAGLSPQANTEAARMVCRESGVSVERFDEALEMFNQVGMKS